MKLNFLTSFIIANLKHDTTKNNIISTSPGGKKGLYYLGSLNYIKNVLLEMTTILSKTYYSLILQSNLYINPS